MKIIWLEDDPKTIRNTVNYIKEKVGATIIICESFAEFSQELCTLEDSLENIIIIDIRMLFNIENEFSCFEKDFFVKNGLDAGFEYYKECLEGRFSKIRTAFFSSKPFDKVKLDAKDNNIEIDKIITKDEPDNLLNFIKGIK